MLPSLLSREIVQGLRSFIITDYETGTPYFEGLFTRFVESPGNLYKGPYLSIDLPFQPGTAGRDDFQAFVTVHPPHAHQQLAWERLFSETGGRSTLIATGTGSGYLQCGILAHGFARALCPECGHDFLVAFSAIVPDMALPPASMQSSCKGRGVCPSCTTRRMVETAAHLVARVFPRLPVRQ